MKDRELRGRVVRLEDRVVFLEQQELAMRDKYYALLDFLQLKIEQLPTTLKVTRKK